MSIYIYTYVLYIYIYYTCVYIYIIVPYLVWLLELAAWPLQIRPPSSDLLWSSAARSTIPRRHRSHCTPSQSVCGGRAQAVAPGDGATRFPPWNRLGKTGGGTRVERMWTTSNNKTQVTQVSCFDKGSLSLRFEIDAQFIALFQVLRCPGGFRHCVHSSMPQTFQGWDDRSQFQVKKSCVFPLWRRYLWIIGSQKTKPTTRFEFKYSLLLMYVSCIWEIIEKNDMAMDQNGAMLNTNNNNLPPHPLVICL